MTTLVQERQPTTILPRLVGTIIGVPDGYGFIQGAQSLEGEPFETGGDVFLHQDDCAVPICEGLRVEFSLVADLKRAGKFRAVGAVAALHLPALAGEAIQLPVLARRQPYHVRVKRVAPEHVRTAYRNEPLKSVIGVEVGDLVDLTSGADVARLVEAYLEETFSGLRAYDVSFDLDLAASERERSCVATAVALQREIGFANQAAVIEAEYELFTATIGFLRQMREAGMLVPGQRLSTSALRLMVGNPGNLRARRGSDMGSVAADQERIDLFTRTIRFLCDHQLIGPCSVIPIEHVADLLMAAPVWFIESKDSLPETWGIDDPYPDEAVRYFAGLLGTQEFAHAYQIFNRRTRRLRQYQGDAIPPHILAAIAKAKTYFDFVVVATPYLDIAGREWQDPAWLALIDPFVFGFKRGLPYMFFLGRWSDTGLFPLIGEMVADTVDYLRQRTPLLNGFKSAFWHFVKLDHPDISSLQPQPYLKYGALVPFATNLVAHFDNGTLFDFLRGTPPR